MPPVRSLLGSLVSRQRTRRSPTPSTTCSNAESLDMLYEAETWVAIAFVLFLAVLAKFGVHRSAVSALDARGARIKSELEEARRLREEAQAVLAQSERRRREAEGEADAIVTSAKAEAEQLAAEAKAKVEEFIARRTKMAEAKIAHAETQALADVRGAAG